MNTPQTTHPLPQPRSSAERRLADLRSSLPAYCTALAPRTIAQVLDSPEPSLHHIAVRLGDTAARAVVSYLLADALELFNVRETMTDVQVALTVDLILEEYPYLQTDDLKLCLRNAMKLRYGEVYNRIDVTVVMGWLRAYNRERCSEADVQGYNAHRRLLSDAPEASTAAPEEGRITRDEYIRRLTDRARRGDARARRQLEVSRAVDDYVRLMRTKKP